MGSPFQWIINKLAESRDVESTSLVNEDMLLINRVNGASLTICSCSESVITLSIVTSLIARYNADFILYTDKEAVFNEGVFEYMDSKRKILGNFKDVLAILKQSTNWPYQHKTVKFLMRILQQHPKVKSVRRLDNKRYEVVCIGLKKVVAIALDEYEIGIEAIRDAIDKFGRFDLIIKSNPYGRISISAKELASSHGIKVLWPRELNLEL